MFNLKALSRTALLALTAASFLGSIPARADVCDTLASVRLEKLKFQNDALVEGHLAKQTLAKLTDLRARAGDIEFYRYLEMIGGSVVLGITWGTTYSNIKESRAVYDNAFVAIKDVLKRSPVFGFFMAAGTFGIVDGVVNLHLHYSNVDRLEKELAARTTVLAKKNAVLQEKVFKLTRAMEEAKCEIPAAELMNGVEGDPVLFKLILGN